MKNNGLVDVANRVLSAHKGAVIDGTITHLRLICVDRTGSKQAVAVATVLSLFLQALGIGVLRTTHVNRTAWECMGLCDTCNKENLTGALNKRLQRLVGSLMALVN